MTYRGVYQDGVVVLLGEVHLREGEVVDVNSSSKGTSKNAGSRSRPKKSRERQRDKVHPFIALAGLWEDRSEWRGKSSVEIVEDLRRRTPPSSSRKRSRRG